MGKINKVCRYRAQVFTDRLNSAFIITAGMYYDHWTKIFLMISPAVIAYVVLQLHQMDISANGTQYETQHDQMIQWINAEKTNWGIDFTVINGDLFHDDVSFLEPVKQRWDNLVMPIMFLTVTTIKREKVIGNCLESSLAFFI
jgi:hypothetical protein